MKKNISTTDRFIRILIAVLFGALYFKGIITGVFGLTMLIIGIVFLLTAMVNFCPIYKLLGLSTNKKQTT